MARRPSRPKELPDALREAVERTVDATLGSAERSRVSAQSTLDDVVHSVDELRRGAEVRLAKSRRSMTEAIEGRRPATLEDMRELKAELRRVSRRLDAIEERLPEKRKPAAKRSSSAKRPSSGQRSSSSKRSSS
jgi:polyhydroxyalkanoate synthesis regulator phasin